MALAVAGIPLIAEDTGLDYGRSVYFHLADGRLQARRHGDERGRREILAVQKGKRMPMVGRLIWRMCQEQPQVSVSLMLDRQKELKLPN